MALTLSKAQNRTVPFECEFEGEKITGLFNIGKMSRQFFDSLSDDGGIDEMVKGVVTEWDIAEEVELDVEVDDPKKPGQKKTIREKELINLPVERASELPFDVLRVIWLAIQEAARPNPQKSNKTGSFG